jgi:hypothetical protein
MPDDAEAVRLQYRAARLAQIQHERERATNLIRHSSPKREDRRHNPGDFGATAAALFGEPEL